LGLAYEAEQINAAPLNTYNGLGLRGKDLLAHFQRISTCEECYDAWEIMRSASDAVGARPRIRPRFSRTWVDAGTLTTLPSRDIRRAANAAHVDAVEHGYSGASWRQRGKEGKFSNTKI